MMTWYSTNNSVYPRPDGHRESNYNRTNGEGNQTYRQYDEYPGIRNVWKSNLYEEFNTINQAVKKYPWIAMDTEFPGIVARPVGQFKSSRDYQYHLLKVNVDLLKIIQLGLTFMDKNGSLRPEISTWQFNFKFSLKNDMYAEESVELLKSSGIQFARQEEEGIDVFEFAELLLVSGVVLDGQVSELDFNGKGSGNERVKFLSFHSGFDFAYLIKILTGTGLPSEESEFFELLRLYFPLIYDVKYIMKSCKDLKGGLQEIADQMNLTRVGPQHQAGSDSLLTGAAFFKMKEKFFENTIEEEKYCGQLYGHGVTFSSSIVAVMDVTVLKDNGEDIDDDIDEFVVVNNESQENDRTPSLTYELQEDDFEDVTSMKSFSSEEVAFERN